MHIPIQLAAAREAWVGVGRNAGGDQRADGVAGESVKQGGEYDFVEVQRECREMEFVREGLDESDEGCRGWDGEGVEHVGCWSAMGFVCVKRAEFVAASLV